MLSILVAHSYFLRFDEKQRQRAKPYPPLATITRAARLQTDESVRLLKELGCYRIWIGSESGSQKILGAQRRRGERGVVIGREVVECKGQGPPSPSGIEES